MRIIVSRFSFSLGETAGALIGLCQKLNLYFLCFVRLWTVMYIRRMLQGASLPS